MIFGMWVHDHNVVCVVYRDDLRVTLNFYLKVKKFFFKKYFLVRAITFLFFEIGQWYLEGWVDSKTSISYKCKNITYTTAYSRTTELLWNWTFENTKEKIQ
jgi:hypothetical protein